MLSLEQCKNLKEWGLPRGQPGAKFYDVGTKYAIDEPLKKVVIPDLEQLLEFANGKVSDELKLSPDSHFLSLDCPMANGEWEAHYTTTTAISATDPDPCQAIYKLIEKVMTGAPVPTKE